MQGFVISQACTIVQKNNSILRRYWNQYWNRQIWVRNLISPDNTLIHFVFKMIFIYKIVKKKKIIKKVEKFELVINK